MEIGSGRQIDLFPGVEKSIALGTGSVPIALAIVTINGLSKNFSATSHYMRGFRERSILIKMMGAKS